MTKKIATLLDITDIQKDIETLKALIKEADYIISEIDTDVIEEKIQKLDATIEKSQKTDELLKEIIKKHNEKIKELEVEKEKIISSLNEKINSLDIKQLGTNLDIENFKEKIAELEKEINDKISLSEQIQEKIIKSNENLLNEIKKSNQDTKEYVDKKQKKFEEDIKKLLESVKERRVYIGSATQWGQIGGNIQLQTDLQNALNQKANDSIVLKKDGSVALTSNWNVDGDGTLFIDKANGRVGVKTTTPQYPLDVNGVGSFQMLLVPVIRPKIDGAEAIKIDSADGTKNIIKIDTVNKRVAINFNDSNPTTFTVQKKQTGTDWWAAGQFLTEITQTPGQNVDTFPAIGSFHEAIFYGSQGTIDTLFPVMGFLSYAKYQGTGTSYLQRMYGVQNGVYIWGGSSGIEKATNFNVWVDIVKFGNNNPGNIDTWVAFNADLLSSLSYSAGVITNGYVVYAPPKPSYITNYYSIYAAGGIGYFADRVGIGSGVVNPTARLHIQGLTGYNQLRLATSYTPTSSADANGNVGDVAWDNDFIYIKTSGGWKRAALSTF